MGERRCPVTTHRPHPPTYRRDPPAVSHMQQTPYPPPPLPRSNRRVAAHPPCFASCDPYCTQRRDEAAVTHPLLDSGRDPFAATGDRRLAHRPSQNIHLGKLLHAAVTHPL